jgi:hypothetical protein
MLQYQLIFPHASNYLGSVKVTFLSTGPCFLLLEDLQSVLVSRQEKIITV